MATIMASPTSTVGPQIATETSVSTLAPDTTLPLDLIEQLNKQKELKEFAEWAQTEYRKAKNARVQIERQWYLNAAFYQGRQWVTYTPQALGLGYKLVTPPVPPYRVRSTVNRVRSVIRMEMSRLTSNKPNAMVVPASSEDEDLFAAQAGEQVWESLYSTHKLATVFRRSIFWTVICGTGYMKVWWDKNSVCRLPNGTELRGDIKYAPVSPFHIMVPDLTEEEIENQPWVINCYTKTVDWIKQAYGEDFKASCVSTTEIMDNGFLNLQAAGDNAKPDSVLVLEVWLKAGAHKLFPKGGYATVVDNRVVQLGITGPLFKHYEFPFVKFDHIPTGAYYAASVVEDVIPIQRELNRTRSQIIEAKNRMAKPQLIAARGSIDPSKITSEPGIVIQYRPGLPPPAPLPLTQLPNYVLQEIDRCLADIEDVTSQHQVSKGGSPTGVTAATAISYLQERDDSILSTTYQSIEAGWEKIAKQTLSHVNQFWETERIVQIVGVDGSFDSIALKGSDIESGKDIRVEAGSALPVSKAARQSLLMDMMVQGLIPPEKGLKMMEIGGVTKLYEEMATDERQAQRENLRMRSLDIQAIEQHMAMANESLEAADNGENIDTDMQTGEPLLTSNTMVFVNTWDNHAIHIEIHNRFRKGQTFEQLDDQIKMQFEAHVQMHAMALNQSASIAQMTMPPDASSGPPLSDNTGGEMPPGTEAGMPTQMSPSPDAMGPPQDSSPAQTSSGGY